MPRARELAGLLRTCSRIEDARNLHSAIASLGVNPETNPSDHRYLSNLLIQAFGRLGAPAEAHHAFQALRNPNIFSWSLLMSAYLQNGELHEAKMIFERMPSRDVVIWNSLAASNAQYRHLELAEALLGKMAAWTVVSWTILLTAFVQECRLEKALEIFEKMPERNEVSWNSMLAAFAQKGLVSECRIILEKMSSWTVVSWNEILSAHVEDHRFQEAKELFDRMPERTSVSWNSILQGVEVGELWRRFGKFPSMDVVSWTTMLVTLVRDERVVEAKRVFDEMPERNCVTWNTMVSASSECGCHEQAERRFQEMKLEGVKVDDICFLSILAACSHGGLVERGRGYFHSMVDDFWIAPRSEHFYCLVDLLGRSGRVNEADELMEHMPFVPDESAWKTLLGAHDLSPDANRADSRTSKLKNYPLSASAHVLLANIISGHAN